MPHCTVCGRLYLQNKRFRHHIQSLYNQQSFTCDQCGKSFSRADNLTKHLRACTGHMIQPQLPPQRPTTTTTTTTTTPDFVIRRQRTTKGGAVKRCSQPTMMNFQRKHQTYKFQIGITIVCHKAGDPSFVTQPPVTLTSEMTAVYDDTTPPLDDVNRQLLNYIEVFELNGSGWVFSHFESLQFILRQLVPLRGSEYIPLPLWIQTKRAVVNVSGTGDDCFKWAVLAGMHPVDAHTERMSKYAEHMGKNDFSSLRFPAPFSSVGPFAAANNLFINVYGVDDDKEVIYPLRVSSTPVSDRHVCLLLFDRGGIKHYSTIRNFSRLVSSQLSHHNGTVYCCKRCLHAYSSQELLGDHAIDCCHVQRTKSSEDPRCRFTNIQKQLLIPFVVYADFESILQRVNNDEAMEATQGVAVGGDEPTASGPFHEHLTCSFAYMVVSSVVPDFSRPLASYRGEDVGEMFVRKLQEEAKQLFQEYIVTPQQLPELTEEELRILHTATNCPICDQLLGGDKVRNHCHILGNYWGTAHSRCSVQNIKV